MADVRTAIRANDQVSEEFAFPAGAVLPVQFYSARRGTASVEPLQRLMVAMLVDAVRCFQTKFAARQPARRQEFAEVRSWLFSDEENGMFSFKAVCDALEVNPEALRKSLVGWEERRLSGEKPGRMIRRLAAPTAKRISR